ncbi:threonine--tRNA ligase [Clostridium botulinum]|uniref:threonine--tRNA ligase n=1 Tax=Clostridium botulinum TaxID=1491 RepID=UPI000773A832|nr:threonine--tRNA ligase [Clostridium botulinum]MBY6930173.1 threonine--tRNA ligase [Clostridium botulinum]NFG20391.1 threonine--tRNA ligase [Clostridium botulinum]NFO81801.1 threonine--tRNA ligase [Clostridium botulinum]
MYKNSNNNLLKGSKNLNKNLKLFSYLNIVGDGLPIILNRGFKLKRTIENFLIKEEIKRDYVHVSTPPLGKQSLYETTGHYNKYSKDMYPSFYAYDEDYVMRSVTCPNHYAIFLQQERSYKELPLRITEMSTLIRKDRSSELSGLYRTNTFTLNDAHIFCSQDNIELEFLKIIDFIKCVNDKFGISSHVRYRLSFSDFSNDKYIKNESLWKKSENILESILNKSDLDFFISKDKACFYGPKLDVLIENYNGKEYILTTVQLDFILPGKFNVYFINNNFEKEQPVVIHRALPFSIERTIAFLTEYYQGIFPFWLAPEQVVIIPTTLDNIEYSQQIEYHLKEIDIRTECDLRDTRFNKKIKQAIMNRTPYIVIVGDKESKNNMVTIRNRNNEQQFLTLEDFIQKLDTKNRNCCLSTGLL